MLEIEIILDGQGEIGRVSNKTNEKSRSESLVHWASVLAPSLLQEISSRVAKRSKI